jgi:hypothetical protein
MDYFLFIIVITSDNSHIIFALLINNNTFLFNLKIFKTMSEEKTYVFDSASGSNIISALAPMLQNRGIDPSVLALMNNNDGFGGNGGW